MHGPINVSVLGILEYGVPFTLMYLLNMYVRLRYSLFWDVTQGKLVVTKFLKQLMGHLKL